MFVDGENSDLALECVCRAFDNAECPESMHIYVLVPLSSTKPTVWDTGLASTCSARSSNSYSQTLFETNVHIYKMSFKHFGKGGVSTVTQVLHSLESIQSDELILWLPYLSKLDLHWDTKVLEDWTTLPTDSALSFPLQMVSSLEKGIEDLILFKKNESLPCFYFITSSHDLAIRPQAKALTHTTPYLSVGYPLLMKKSSFLLESGHDLEISFGLWKQSISMFVSKYSLGFTYLNQSSSSSLNSFSTEWLELIGIKGSLRIQGLMGMSAQPTLQEKVFKYGSEIKYQSFKESLVMEGYEE